MTNKERIAHAFAGLAEGDGAGLVGLLADEVVWTINGSTTWSGALNGKGEVIERLLIPLSGQLAHRPVLVATRLIAEGDLVVVEARGENTTKSGKPYNNRYCFVMRLAEGQIREVTEYLDTELVTASLDARP